MCLVKVEFWGHLRSAYTFWCPGKCVSFNQMHPGKMLQFGSYADTNVTMAKLCSFVVLLYIGWYSILPMRINVGSVPYFGHIPPKRTTLGSVSLFWRQEAKVTMTRVVMRYPVHSRNWYGGYIHPSSTFQKKEKFVMFQEKCTVTYGPNGEIDYPTNCPPTTWHVVLVANGCNTADIHGALFLSSLSFAVDNKLPFCWYKKW